MKNNIRSIKEAGIARRILAFIMDGVVSVFVFFGLMGCVFSPIANKKLAYTNLQAEGTKLQAYSKLYVVYEPNEEGNKIFNPNSIEELPAGNIEIDTLYDYYIEDNDKNEEEISIIKERLHYYYCCYKTGENVEYPEGRNPDDYKAPNYKDLIENDKGEMVSPSAYYTEEWFFSNIGSITDKKEILNAAYDATEDFYYQPYIQDLNKKLKGIQAFIIFPSYFISYFTFFILIPILFKNGETLGKKVLNIGFVTKDGFTIKKRQIVVRQILLFVLTSLVAFGIGIGFTSFAFLGLGIFIYYLATFISKTKKSPVDYFAYTYLIDTRNSVWFLDANEEENKEVELDKNMSKYHKEPAKNKNLIQVGTEIVDQDVKREFEEEKLKKENK